MNVLTAAMRKAQRSRGHNELVSERKVRLVTMLDFGSPWPPTPLLAHRLYYRGRWNWIDLKERANEILGHHIERCGHVLLLISEGSNTVDEIVKGHFEPAKIKGLGMMMARNEIRSHLELLEVSEDVRWVDRKHLECNGTARFEACIHSL